MVQPSNAVYSHWLEAWGGGAGWLKGGCAGFPGNSMIFTSHSENLGKINLTHTIERET